MTVSKFLARLVGRIIEVMPMSVLVKLEDRKIDAKEANELKEQLFEIIAQVFDEVTGRE